MISFVIQHHAYRPLAYLRRELVRCLAHNRSFLSGVGASDNPGAVQSLIFSMPEGTDTDKVLGAVRALAHAELRDNHDYVLALHNDTSSPHVHLTVPDEGLDRTRLNSSPVHIGRDND